ncbi:MAG: U32 family peptidase [Halanaerobacter sp.]
MAYFQKPELLSPAGDWDSLYAAVQNGCDAVYLGVKGFNARNRANNFSTAELEEVIDYAHLRNVKVYIAANILYKEEEIRDVLDFITQIYDYGADAIIVQDLGIAKLILEFFPDIELHASTQMNIHNLAGAQLLEELGFERVILARELNLAQIKEINKGTDLKIETFVHGAVCISYSGQCLMSSLIGGRSGNRGRCAQPCRMPYTLIDRASGEVIDKEFQKDYLLSPKDINTLEIIPELVKAGINSFKIEGRVKRPEYTALATKLYRKYIDQYFHDRDNYEVNAQDQQKLAQIFNRSGFIPGYYKGQENLDLISQQRPKNWGLKIGEVTSYNPQTKECQIRLNHEVNEGDGIEIWTQEGDNIALTLSDFESNGQNLITIEVERNLNRGAVVYKTSDQELLTDLAKSYQQPNTLRKIELYAKVTARIDQPLKIDLWDQDGYFVTAELDFIVEEAKNQPLREAEIEEQLEKLGATPYSLVQLNLALDSNIFIPISKLNQLRREAVQKIDQARVKGFEPSKRRNGYDRGDLKVEPSKSRSNLKVTAAIKNNKQLEAVRNTSVERIYIPLKNLNLAQIKRTIANKDETEIFLQLPRIASQKELEEFKEKVEVLEETELDGYLLSQLGAVELVKESTKSLAADFSFNLFNSYSLSLMEELNFSSAALAPELTLREIEKLGTDIDKELIVYGYLPMMHSTYCPIGAVARKFDFSQSCQLNCQERSYGLQDRKGMVEPIETDPKNCRSIIYNSQPLHLLNHLAKIKDSNCDSLRLNFTFEGKEETEEIIKDYQAKLENARKKISSAIKDYTTGHFFRGVK